VKAKIKVNLNEKGYTLEAKIPWNLIWPEMAPPQSGDQIAFTWEVSLASNNPSEPKRIFQIFANGGSANSFRSSSDWGLAIFK